MDKKRKPMQRLRVPNFELPTEVGAVVQRLWACGARPFLTGGAVRDLLFGMPIKDYDFEVYGMEADALEGVLRTAGPRTEEVERVVVDLVRRWIGGM